MIIMLSYSNVVVRQCCRSRKRSVVVRQCCRNHKHSVVVRQCYQNRKHSVVVRQRCRKVVFPKGSVAKVIMLL